MNKIGMALKELYEAEEELADEYVKVGERLAAEHDVWYDCRRFAEECHAPADDDTVGTTTTAALRHKLAEALGRRPESGLLLLRSLRQLYLQAQEVSFLWLIAGQLAQATRDPDLLALVDELHRETLTQIKWLKTQTKQASPQALVVGSGG
jgi:hypothetical protein